MTALEAARDRSETVRSLARAVLDRVCSDRLDGALAIGAEGVRRFAEADVTFAVEEHVLDVLIGALSVLKEVADRRDHPERARAATLLDAALGLRIEWLLGVDGRGMHSNHAKGPRGPRKPRRTASAASTDLQAADPA